jgi:DNA-binding MarR family transcriptional regulator
MPATSRGVQRADRSLRIVDLYGQLFNAFLSAHTDAWLSAELTMPQMKALLLVAARGSATGSQLARGLGVGLPSVTRFVDRLCEHGLIERREDPDDRRVSSIELTATGRTLVENLNDYRRDTLTAFLCRLDDEQLGDVERGVLHLVEVATAPAPPSTAVRACPEPGKRDQ